jgi:hypothetical protein
MIVLGPTGNLQGTYKLFSLATGKKIKRQKMTAYPMPNMIIKKVEQFCKANTTLNAFNFSRRSGVLSEGITSVLSALGFLNPGLHLMQTLFIF